jgi:hypothetical protein
MEALLSSMAPCLEAMESLADMTGPIADIMESLADFADVIGFASGMVFGATKYFLVRKVFIGSAKKGLGALYITQMLILSYGALAMIFFFWRDALVAAAIGIVASSMVLAVIFNLKGFAVGKH